MSPDQLGALCVFCCFNKSKHHNVYTRVFPTAFYSKQTRETLLSSLLHFKDDLPFLLSDWIILWWCNRGLLVSRISSMLWHWLTWVALPLLKICTHTNILLLTSLPWKPQHQAECGWHIDIFKACPFWASESELSQFWHLDSLTVFECVD